MPNVVSFIREAVPDPDLLLVIRSRCKACGHEITASLSGGIAGQEYDHATQCGRKGAETKEIASTKVVRAAA
jgi:hypothetical protein